MNSINAPEWARLRVVETAAAVIGGTLGVIEGARRLADLAHHVVPDWRVDQDFVVFGALASDTDHLPTGSARQYWSSEALAREDRNIARIEASAREEVVSACESVMRRFGDAPGTSGARA